MFALTGQYHSRERMVQGLTRGLTLTHPLTRVVLTLLHPRVRSPTVSEGRLKMKELDDETSRC